MTHRAQSPWVIAEQNADAIRGRMLVRHVIGERDHMLNFNRQFHEHMTRLGIEHEFIVLPSVGHNPPAVLRALGERNWKFYRAAFGKLHAAPQE